jgi:hypothetical protein
LKFVSSNFFRLISNDPDVEANCRECVSAVLSKVVTTVGEYDYIAVYPECGLTKLDMNVKGVTVLLRVGTSTTALSEVSTNRCRSVNGTHLPNSTNLGTYTSTILDSESYATLFSHK